MFKNYLKIALRTFRNNKIYSGINVLGLTLGLTCTMLIMLWVQDEYKVDAFHIKLERIYKVYSQEYMEGEVLGSYDTPGLLGDELPKAIPEVELACSYSGYQYLTLSTEDKIIKRPCKYAGKDFFKIFTYPLLEGSPESALSHMEDVAISEKLANNFFGSSKNAIGQLLKFENYKPLKVSAVFADIPDHSSEKFEFIMSWELNLERDPWLKDWHNSGPETFVLLKPAVSVSAVNQKIQKFIAGYDKEFRENDRLELALQPYGEKYLHSQFKNGFLSGGRIEYVRLFSLVAIFILFIACINFMNLSTARSVKRAKEIGIRKVIGAGRRSLIAQFMGEAFIYTGGAVLLSILLLVTLINPFNQLTGKHIHIPWDRLNFNGGLIALILVTTLISGSYPALLLSSFKPIAVLKNNLKLGSSATWMRQGLVIFQFVLCIVFISSMLIINRQVDYIHHKNLGYEKNNLLYLPISGTLRRQFDSFKSEALKIPGIKYISKMSARPIELENTTGGVEWPGKPPNSSPRFTQLAVSYDFVNTMQSTVVSGRDFSTAYADSASYLINEKALDIIKLDDPVGKPLTFWGIKGQIVGVIKDFHFESLHKPITPLVVRLMGYPGFGYAMIRTEPGKTQSVVNELEKLHKEMNPDFLFAYQFADEEYGAMYQSEQLVRTLSWYFTVLAIVISCLGLLGLVTFSAEQRRKEIGIRKVLGASVSSLFALLSVDFLLLVGMAFFVATPLSWWFMNHWLEGYAYRITMTWSIFLVAGMAAAGIAMVAVSYQALKASRANPVVSIRTE